MAALKTAPFLTPYFQTSALGICAPCRAMQRHYPESELSDWIGVTEVEGGIPAAHKINPRRFKL